MYIQVKHRKILDNLILQRQYNGKSQLKSDLNTTDYDEEVIEQLNNSYHKTDEISFDNTYRYLFNKRSQGIFVKIKNKTLVCFIILSNQLMSI